MAHPSFVSTAGVKAAADEEKEVGGGDVSTDELERMTRGLQNLTLKRRRRGGRIQTKEEEEKAYQKER